ncbi:MAG: fumarate hydratase C-terminal domain-containing protein [Deltaproteobacteria bacterium]|nr:fumarate hydratase C-terminal domain-containing protein [Deltaproteobacteria bacterium]
MIELATPLSEEQIRSLHAGDRVVLSGIAVTGRDAAHKYLVETLIEGPRPLPPADKKIYEELESILRGGAIYHSGPIVRAEGGTWSFVSAGPTTSIRDEIYQDKVIAAFGVRVVIGKGGMGARTLAACKKYGAVYLHAIGGAGVYDAASVSDVIEVFMAEEFGLPEAFWKIRFHQFPGIVTMDAHGKSLHDDLAGSFDKRLTELIRGRDR